jgi:hypothetical protein
MPHDGPVRELTFEPEEEELDDVARALQALERIAASLELITAAALHLSGISRAPGAPESDAIV